MTRFGVAMSHYGQASFDYARLDAELETAKIPRYVIRGSPYPEMTRAEQVREFLESDLEVLVFVDGNVKTGVGEIRMLVDAAEEAGVALPWDDQEHVPWAHALEFAAIHRNVVERMKAEETRRYHNVSAAEVVTNGERKWACPLASPWNRDGSPLVAGEWLTESEAFLMRAQRVLLPGQWFWRGPIGAKVSRRPIVTSIANENAPVTGEPGSKFALCIPSFGGLDVDQTDRVRALEKAGMMVIRIHDCPWIDVSRSWLAETALSHGRGVFFLDHDVIFGSNDVLRLCEQALERNAVVAGAYCMRKSGKNVIGAFDVPPGPITFFEGGSTLPAHYSGMGFTAIPSAVLEEIELPKVQSFVLGRHLRPWFALDCSTGFYAGEDVSFCKRVHDLSIQAIDWEGPDGRESEWVPTHSGRKPRVFIDTRVRLAHRGSYDYGIEDAGCVVPRCVSLDTIMTENRAEARAMLKSAIHDVDVDARLDMIEGYSRQPEQADSQNSKKNPEFEAI